MLQALAFLALFSAPDFGLSDSFPGLAPDIDILGLIAGPSFCNINEPLVLTPFSSGGSSSVIDAARIMPMSRYDMNVPLLEI